MWQKKFQDLHIKGVEYIHEREGRGKFKITVVTSTIRTDRVFFDIKFDTPITSIEVFFFFFTFSYLYCTSFVHLSFSLSVAFSNHKKWPRRGNHHSGEPWEVERSTSDLRHIRWHPRRPREREISGVHCELPRGVLLHLPRDPELQKVEENRRRVQHVLRGKLGRVSWGMKV